MVKSEFVKYGDTFTCILSGVVHSIYKRTAKHGRDKGYEVIRPIVVAQDLIYPSSSFWGTYGWTYSKLEDAIKQMELKDQEFVNKEEAKVCSQTP